ncbi:MAG: helix-turn-helix domain-containing protein [Candidatus Poseidoniaceae archaeon]|nr:helix-turn-helix domain-containing protein [Candidatus Poseidoniaceae archaeon]
MARHQSRGLRLERRTTLTAFATRFIFRRLSAIYCTVFKDPRQASPTMFSVRIQEVPLPTTERDIDGLVAWFIETLCLVRKRGEATADLGRAGPVHRLLRDFLFAQPTSSWDAQMLADELALTPASLNHHLARLVESGLVGYTNEGKGWRRYYLRGGSLSNAIEFFSVQTQTIVRQRLALIGTLWTREPLRMALEVPESDPPLLSLGVVEVRPVRGEDENQLSQWMGDFGLLGERPGKEANATSISVQLFEILLARGAPLSLDEAAELVDGPKARLGRILERFRSSGAVERVPRIDRLSIALWTAMLAQHQRRGEDWMLKKGGFQRLLGTKQQSSLLSKLKKGKLTVEDVDDAMKSVEAAEQMLLLNLLGGRLPMGHRMSGEGPEETAKRVTERLDRVLRRMRRVGELVEQLDA